MPKLVRRDWIAFVVCLAMALSLARAAHGDENFWTRPNNSHSTNDKNTTNWAGSQSPPAGSNIPIGAPPKANPFKRAASAMGSAASSFSNGVKGLFTRSKNKLDGGDSSPSLSGANKPPSKPLDANFHVTLAQLQERTNNLDGAEEQYRKALELDQNHLAAQLGYGRLYDRQERYSEALEWYLKATQKHPQESAAFNDLGLCYVQLKKLPEASAALERAVALQPTRKLYRNNLATVLVKMNRPDEAYQQLAAVHPQAVARYNIGYLLSQQNERQLAYRYFSDALAADPNLQEARQWRDLLAPMVAINPAPGTGTGEVAGAEFRQAAVPPVSDSVAPQLAAPAGGQNHGVPTLQPSGSTQPAPTLPPGEGPSIGGRYPTLPPRASAAPQPSASTAPAFLSDDEGEADHSAAVRADDGEPPLPVLEDAAARPASAADRLAAPAPESIGAPSGSNLPAQAERPKRAQRPAYVAPSRY